MEQSTPTLRLRPLGTDRQKRKLEYGREEWETQRSVSESQREVDHEYECLCYGRY